jgi:hypothetical protein
MAILNDVQDFFNRRGAEDAESKLERASFSLVGSLYKLDDRKLR